MMATTSDRKEEFVVLPSKTQTGVPIFSVLVKRTYAVRPAQAAARIWPANPLGQVDVYYEPGDPESATVKYETDLSPYKLATDFVVIGKAYAPHGKPVAELEVSVGVAGYEKVIHVTGDRHCVYRESRPPAFSDPLEFTEIELRYERAYGGKDLRSHPDLPFFDTTR
jgi:hypothetical protein